jgi:hypothetical protein
MVTRSRAGRSGVRKSVGLMRSVLSRMSGRLWGPPSFSGYWCSSRGIIQPGGDIDHSPLSSVKVTNGWRYISASPVCLNGLQRDNFIFIFSSNSEYLRFRLPSSLCTALYVLGYILFYVLHVTFFATYSAIRSLLLNMMQVFYTNCLRGLTLIFR